MEVAAQLGHAPTKTLNTYAHVMADLGDDRRSAADVIEDARAHLGKPDGIVPTVCPREAQIRRLTA